MGAGAKSLSVTLLACTIPSHWGNRPQRPGSSEAIGPILSRLVPGLVGLSVLPAGQFFLSGFGIPHLQVL